VTFLQRLARQPQSLWLRKAIFQVHMWTGLTLAIYIFLISVSGSAIVFRRQMSRMWGERPVKVDVTGSRMTQEQLEAAAVSAFPGYRIKRFKDENKPDIAIEMLLERGPTTKRRLFNPYTGADLGNPLPVKMQILQFLVSFHDDLLGGATGRKINGIGGGLFVLLGLTGLTIWWRGTKSWWRGLVVKGSVSARRLNFDLHSAIGFWSLAFVLMWGVTAIYLAFPDPFNGVVDYLQPPADSPGIRAGDIVLEYFAKVHIGRWAGPRVSTLWTIIGLLPAVLAVTGTIMWWNRVVRPARAAFAEQSAVQTLA
jgi:uncharacterized iron-regulated membrane protein